MKFVDARFDKPPGWYIIVHAGTPKECATHDFPFASRRETEEFLDRHRDYIEGDAGFGVGAQARITLVQRSSMLMG